MLAIRLPEEIEKRLNKLAVETGRSKTYYARQAILAYLDDLEDIYLADMRFDDLKTGRSTTYSLAEVAKELGYESAD